MPARLHTTLPDAKGHAAERAFLERLVELGDTRTQVWGNVDYLQGVGDIDTILLHPDIGMFTVEIKGVSLDLIETYGLKHCVIRGRSGPHPVDQIGLATTDLWNYLGRFPGARAPFFLMTAAFPRITRRAFVERFNDPQVVLHADSLIFAEDLESATKLWSRLLTIRETPAKGRGAKDPIPTADQVARFTDLIKPGPILTPSQADQERGGVLRRQLGAPSQVSQKYLQPGERPPTIFRGAPGTGKTVRLLEIAVAHARAGRAVLFTCFNRVLASSLRGIMASQRLGDEVTNRVVITHVDELRKQLADDLDIFGGTFGTVCVDEGQDMADDAFEFLNHLAAPSAEWFIADGPGQELYGSPNKTGEPSAFLAQARANGVVETLRRNFRNSSAGYLVAQAVFEKSPNLAAIPSGWRSTPFACEPRTHPRCSIWRAPRWRPEASCQRYFECRCRKWAAIGVKRSCMPTSRSSIRCWRSWRRKASAAISPSYAHEATGSRSRRNGLETRWRCSAYPFTTKSMAKLATPPYPRITCASRRSTHRAVSKLLVSSSSTSRTA